MSEQQLAPVQRVTKGLATMEKQFTSMLPSHIDTKKFLRAAVTAVQNTPDLQEAQYESIISSCQKAASDGLIIDNREAALVVFNTKQGNVWVKKAQYMPMINGILKKARQSGQISTISAHVVHENDDFEYWVDEDGTHFKHKPILKGDSGDLLLAYAVAKLKDGSTQLEVMKKEQIEGVRKVSKSGSDNNGNPKGIWKQWPEEMWRKTVLRRLCKYLPSSTDMDGLNQVFDHDNENYDLDAEEPAPVEKQAGSTVAESVILASEEPKEVEGELVDDDQAGQSQDSDPI